MANEPRFTAISEGWSNTTCVVFHIIDATDPTHWDGEPLAVFSSEDETEVDYMVDQLNSNLK